MLHLFLLLCSCDVMYLIICVLWIQRKTFDCHCQSCESSKYSQHVWSQWGEWSMHNWFNLMPEQDWLLHKYSRTRFTQTSQKRNREFHITTLCCLIIYIWCLVCARNVLIAPIFFNPRRFWPFMLWDYKNHIKYREVCMVLACQYSGVAWQLCWLVSMWWFDSMWQCLWKPGRKFRKDRLSRQIG